MNHLKTTSLFLMFCGALLIVTLPVLAADIFLKPNSEKREGNKSGSVFVPSNKSKTRVFTRKKSTKLEKMQVQAVYPYYPYFDKGLLSMSGEGPKNKEELFQLTSMHAAPGVNAALEVQNRTRAALAMKKVENQQAIERQKLVLEQEQEKLAMALRARGEELYGEEEAGEEAGLLAEGEEEADESGKKAIYLKDNKSLKKPRKLFNNYR